MSSSDRIPSWLWWLASSRSGTILFVLTSSTAINLLTGGSSSPSGAWYCKYGEVLGGVLVMLGAFIAARLEGMQIALAEFGHEQLPKAIQEQRRSLLLTLLTSVLLTALGIGWVIASRTA